MIRIPLFHPNIAPSRICIADETNWTPDEDLATLIFRIGRMIQYQHYNLDSALNETAANWARRNKGILPIGRINLFDPATHLNREDYPASLPPVLKEDVGIVLL